MNKEYRLICDHYYINIVKNKLLNFVIKITISLVPIILSLVEFKLIKNFLFFFYQSSSQKLP